MAGMTVQPGEDTPVFSEFDPRYVYLGSVETPELIAGVPVVYTTADNVVTPYDPVTRGGGIAHLIPQSGHSRIKMSGATTSPGANFVALIVFWNETTLPTSCHLLNAKNNGFATHGFEIGINAAGDTLNVNGSGTTWKLFNSAGIGTVGQLRVVAVEYSGTSVTASRDGVSLGTLTGIEPVSGFTSGLGVGNFPSTIESVIPKQSFLMAAILGSKGSKTLEQLTTNPWQIFDDGVVGSPTVTLSIIAGSVFSGSASVAGALAGGFVSEVMMNNTETIHGAIPVVWEWRKGTGIGVPPDSVIYGSGTLSAGGVLTIASGLPTGSGELLVASTDRAFVYYQAGIVT